MSAAAAAKILAYLIEDLTRPEGLDSEDLTWRLQRLREATQAIDATTTPAAPAITALELADLMDECSEDGQWNGADICDGLANIIDRNDGWKRCDEHGVYSASKTECPWEH